VRAGGKHNDLDNVGYTARHHTFFEMLGNFSFGDYFKEEAIPLPGSWSPRISASTRPLLVTVYHTDDEAAEIWKKVAGLPDERIIRIATDDNFWRWATPAPAAPAPRSSTTTATTSGAARRAARTRTATGSSRSGTSSSCSSSSSRTARCASSSPQSIDTGMGLERIGALLQGKHDNYDTDLMRALIEASATPPASDPDGPGAVHHRVIADHLRSTSFLIADGVMPSNEGRGYVLRRIMRRAMRHAHLLGAQDPVMHRLVPALVAQMGQAFPELQPRAGADRGDAEAGGDAVQADARPRPEACWTRNWRAARGRRPARRDGVQAL
jgi:alanyl-tRNA synthetase